jgi:hypothetical protein
MAGSTRRRSPWIVFAAAILVLTGLGVIVYGPFLLVPEWMSARVRIPVLGAAPVALVVLGLVSIAAGVGVFRIRTWGRALGVGAAIAGLAHSAWGSLQGVPPGATLADQVAALLTTAGLGTLLALIVLFVLLRRWPRRDRPALA